MAKIKGTIRKKIFHNNSSSSPWGVFSMSGEYEGIITGPFPKDTDRDFEIVADGAEKLDKKYGKQFAAVSVERSAKPVISAEKISGTVENELYYSEDTGWGLYNIVLEDEKVRNTKKSDVLFFGGNGSIPLFQTMTVAGKIPRLLPGCWISASGTREKRYNKYHGYEEEQFQITSGLVIREPVDEPNMVAFLSKGFAYGIGDETAYNIVRHLKSNSLNILKNIEADTARDLYAHVKERVESFEDWDKKTEDEVTAEARLEFFAAYFSKPKKHLSEPAKILLSVPTLGAKKCAWIMTGWFENKLRFEFFTYFHRFGFSSNQIRRMYNIYGKRSGGIETIEHNPYSTLLGKVAGIKFSTVDEYAFSIGISSTDPRRIGGVMSYILDLVEDNGHSCYPEDALKKKTKEFFDQGKGMPEGVIETVFEELVAEGTLSRDINDAGTPMVFNRGNRGAEQGIVWHLGRLSTGKFRRKPDMEFVGEYFREKMGFELDRSQLDAVRLALSNPVSVITGGPGTGKSTIVNGIVAELKSKGENFVLCSPTGKAARNLSDKTGESASTIDRLLGIVPDMDFIRANKTISEKTVIVDEFSMVDLKKAAVLFSAVPDGGRVIIIGDADQLPSVGAGSVLKDIIDSGTVPVARLSVTHRQEKGGIVENAHVINKIEELSKDLPEGAKRASLLTASRDIGGEFSLMDDTKAIDGSMVSRVVELVSKTLPAQFGYGQGDIQVLVPMKRGNAGTYALNRELQKALNPRSASKQELKAYIGDETPWFWRENDLVMNIKNDYDREVFNGEQGVVDYIEPSTGFMFVRYPMLEDKVVKYNMRSPDADNLQPSYAITDHKSQGSEYNCVIALLSMENRRMLRKNLFYTAVTRGKKKCIVVAEPQALEMALSVTNDETRYGMLRERLAGGMEKVRIPEETGRDMTR